MRFDTVEEILEYRADLLNKLYNNLCLVTFMKKGGDIRTMLCTKSSDFVPVYEKKTDRIKEDNRSIISAFDLNKSEYRSFRIENIIDLKIINPKDINKYVSKDSGSSSII